MNVSTWDTLTCIENKIHLIQILKHHEQNVIKLCRTCCKRVKALFPNYMICKPPHTMAIDLCLAQPSTNHIPFSETHITRWCETTPQIMVREIHLDCEDKVVGLWKLYGHLLNTHPLGFMTWIYLMPCPLIESPKLGQLASDISAWCLY